MSLKQKQSKMESLQYSELKTQSYMKSKIINAELVISAFCYRVRMARVKQNYPKSYSDLNCPLLCGSEDRQEHLLTCAKIKENCDKIRLNTTVEYSDIFSTCVDKIKAAVCLLDLAMKVRNEQLEDKIEI